jgi:hypothetical protein
MGTSSSRHLRRPVSRAPGPNLVVEFRLSQRMRMCVPSLTRAASPNTTRPDGHGTVTISRYETLSERNLTTSTKTVNDLQSRYLFFS